MSINQIYEAKINNLEDENSQLKSSLIDYKKKVVELTCKFTELNDRYQELNRTISFINIKELVNQRDEALQSFIKLEIALARSKGENTMLRKKLQEIKKKRIITIEIQD